MMAGESMLFLAARRVPENDEAVGSARGQLLAVGTDRRRPDVALVAIETAVRIGRLQIPEAHVLVPARGGELILSGRKCQARDLLAMALEGAHDLVRPADVPNADGLVGPAGREPFTVFTDR